MTIQGVYQGVYVFSNDPGESSTAAGRFGPDTQNRQSVAGETATRLDSGRQGLSTVGVFDTQEVTGSSPVGPTM
jgi:hypothetical protein